MIVLAHYFAMPATPVGIPPADKTSPRALFEVELRQHLTHLSHKVSTFLTGQAFHTW